MLFEPSGASIFVDALLALLKKAGEGATQKRHQSLEEVLVKLAKGAKGPKTLLQNQRHLGNAGRQVRTVKGIRACL